MTMARTAADPAKRERILRAAWNRIRQYGFAKTTMGEIAADAGIGKGTAYLYFRSKADIMLALTEETNRRILNQLRAISAEDRLPVERLHDVMLHRVHAIAELAHKYPHGDEFFRSFKPEIVRRVDSYVRRQGELAATLIREGNDTGALDVSDPDGTGMFLAQLFERFTPPYDHAPGEADVVPFAESTFDHLLRGMRANDYAVTGAGEKP